MEPSAREKESIRVIKLLMELNLPTGPYDPQYGAVFQLDHHTRMLCDWCKKNDPKEQSLELQIWWRDHQIADQKREARDAEALRVKILRSQALAKLTEEERLALSLKE